MIIDCHGHFTTTPSQVPAYRAQQIAEYKRTGKAMPIQPPEVTDEEIRSGITDNQLASMRERGIDLTIFSPRAVGMDHHFGNEETNVQWAQFNNDLVHRACKMFPDYFVGACQLPQAGGTKPGQKVFDELDRCITGYGFVGANLNPDPTGGRWSDPPLWDKDWWYPLYEKLVQLDVPAMIHVSGSCNPHFDAVATHYINGDTTAFVQFMTSDIFRDFPTLKFVIPHGGGAAPSTGAATAASRRTWGCRRWKKRCSTTCFSTPAFTTSPASTCCSRSFRRKTFCLHRRRSARCAALIREPAGITTIRTFMSTHRRRFQTTSKK